MITPPAGKPLESPAARPVAVIEGTWDLKRSLRPKNCEKPCPIFDDVPSVVACGGVARGLWRAVHPDGDRVQLWYLGHFLPLSIVEYLDRAVDRDDDGAVIPENPPSWWRVAEEHY